MCINVRLIYKLKLNKKKLNNLHSFKMFGDILNDKTYKLQEQLVRVVKISS